MARFVKGDVVVVPEKLEAVIDRLITILRR